MQKEVGRVARKRGNFWLRVGAGELSDWLPLHLVKLQVKTATIRQWNKLQHLSSHPPTHPAHFSTISLFSGSRKTSRKCSYLCVQSWQTICVKFDYVCKPASIFHFKLLHFACANNAAGYVRHNSCQLLGPKFHVDLKRPVELVRTLGQKFVLRKTSDWYTQIFERIKRWSNYFLVAADTGPNVPRGRYVFKYYRIFEIIY